MSSAICGPSRIVTFPNEVGELTAPTAIDLNGPAWSVIDWNPVLSRVQRGADLLVPGVDGLVPRDRYVDLLPASLPMVFDGNQDQTGAVHTGTVAAGLEENRQAFVLAAVVPPSSPATFTLQLTLANGDVRTGPIHCEDFLWNVVGDGIARAVWRISLPEGRLV
jgi:hypothetical protein